MTRVWSLPSVELADRGSLPNIPAIYYATDRTGQILYVGKATNLYLRWNSKRYGAHHKLHELSQYHGVKLHYRQRPLWRLDHDEAVEIERFDPLLNDRDESKVWWISAIDLTTDSLKIGGAIVLTAFIAGQSLNIPALSKLATAARNHIEVKR